MPPRGACSFTTDLAAPVADADAVFIAVGTPSRRGDGFADLSYVYAAAREIAAALSGYTVIVTKSTVPVGTGDEVERIMRELRPDADFAVVSNPEFLREGAAIEDFKRPDRIVIGAEDERAQTVMADVYRPLYLNSAPILNTSRRTAELIKYAANAFLATKITFINEMADLCEQVGANVQDVARGMGLDNRIGGEVPACRAGLWRLLLSEGHAGADQDGAGLRHARAHRRDRRGGERPAQARHGPQGHRGLRRHGARQDDRGARPDLQAEHRRHARCAVARDRARRCRMPAPRSAPIDPGGHGAGQARCCRPA
ncbi:MAG: nucleotide sugar dehydrogenase [Polyangiaceae bacterium]